MEQPSSSSNPPDDPVVNQPTSDSDTPPDYEEDIANDKAADVTRSAMAKSRRTRARTSSSRVGQRAATYNGQGPRCLPRIPSPFIVKQTGFSDRHFAICTESGAPQHAFSFHSAFGLTGPQVCLHAGPTEGTPTLAAVCDSWTTEQDITIYDPQHHEIVTSELVRPSGGLGSLTTIYSFQATVPRRTRRRTATETSDVGGQGTRRDTFEWRPASSLSGGTWQLVRLSSRGEGADKIVAAWGDGNSIYGTGLVDRYSGRFAFVGSAARGDLGGSFEILAVASALLIFRKTVRNRHEDPLQVHTGFIFAGGPLITQL